MICADSTVAIPVNSSTIAEYSYSGDQNYLASKGRVSGAVTAADTTTSVTTSSATATWGSEQSLVFSATVDDSQPGSVGVPTGAVSIEQGSDVICTMTLSNGSGTCSPAATAISPGTDPITASYGGDSNFNPSPLSSPVSLTISPASLSVTGDDETMPYGSPLPTLGSTISGFVNGQSLATSGVTGQSQCTTDRHDHQSRWDVPDHVHRRVARLLRLFIRIRTGNTHRVTGSDRSFVDVCYSASLLSYSDRLLRVQRYSHRFGHLSRRHRQLLLRSVHPDGRFRFLRRNRQPEHFPGHLLGERHVFGRRQFHGLVIERGIDGAEHRGDRQHGDWSWNQLGARRCWWYQPDLGARDSQNTVSLASLLSSAQTYEDDVSVSQQTQIDLQNQVFLRNLIAALLQKQAEANANRTGSHTEAERVAPGDEHIVARCNRAQTG